MLVLPVLCSSRHDAVPVRLFLLAPVSTLMKPVKGEVQSNAMSQASRPTEA